MLYLVGKTGSRSLLDARRLWKGLGAASRSSRSLRHIATPYRTAAMRCERAREKRRHGVWEQIALA